MLSTVLYSLALAVSAAASTAQSEVEVPFEYLKIKKASTLEEMALNGDRIAIARLALLKTDEAATSLKKVLDKKSLTIVVDGQTYPNPQALEVITAIGETESKEGHRILRSLSKHLEVASKDDPNFMIATALLMAMGRNPDSKDAQVLNKVAGDATADPVHRLYALEGALHAEFALHPEWTVANKTTFLCQLPGAFPFDGRETAQDRGTARTAGGFRNDAIRGAFVELGGAGAVELWTNYQMVAATDAKGRFGRLEALICNVAWLVDQGRTSEFPSTLPAAVRACVDIWKPLPKTPENDYYYGGHHWMTGGLLVYATHAELSPDTAALAQEIYASAPPGYLDRFRALRAEAATTQQAARQSLVASIRTLASQDRLKDSLKVLQSALDLKAKEVLPALQAAVLKEQQKQDGDAEWIQYLLDRIREFEALK